MPKITRKGRATRDNVVQYLDINVYEAAKKRIREIIEQYDAVLVGFSGGKDSLTVLNLTKEVYDEMGIKEPVKCYFYDEELIPDSVIDFVNEYRQKDWIQMHWLCFQLKSNKYILGKTFDYVQWDKNRRHIRPKPAWGIENGDKVCEQYDIQDYIAGLYRGKVCCMTGIRAQESIIRYKAIVNKISESHLAGSGNPRVTLGRPIYDWSEKDVFRYFYDKKIRYCPIYDAQMLNDMNLRVSTPLHSEASKRIHKLRTLYPTFYEQLMDVFPEIIKQEKYYREYNFTGNADKYRDVNGEVTYDSIYLFIQENITDARLKKLALERTNQCERMNQTVGGYRPEYVMKAIMSGNFKRMILPEQRKR